MNELQAIVFNFENSHSGRFLDSRSQDQFVALSAIKGKF